MTVLAEAQSRVADLLIAGASAERLKEAQSINKSLSALGTHGRACVPGLTISIGDYSVSSRFGNVRCR